MARLTPRAELGLPENRPGVPEPGSALPDDPSSPIVQKFREQHPLHAAFASVYERLGGEEFLLDWAEENPDKFFAMMAKMAPAAPPKGQHGGLHLHVHPTLAAGPLDEVKGQVIDVEPETE